MNYSESPAGADAKPERAQEQFLVQFLLDDASPERNGQAKESSVEGQDHAVAPTSSATSMAIKSVQLELENDDWWDDATPELSQGLNDYPAASAPVSSRMLQDLGNFTSTERQGDDAWWEMHMPTEGHQN